MMFNNRIADQENQLDSLKHSFLKGKIMERTGGSFTIKINNHGNDYEIEGVHYYPVVGIGNQVNTLMEGHIVLIWSPEGNPQGPWLIMGQIVDA